MNPQDINNLLNQIIDNSKYKSVTGEQRDTLKKKLVQKYLNDFNLTAFEMMDAEQQKEFSKILGTQNQNDIDTFIDNNIQTLDKLTEKASEKFIKEVYLLLKE